ncbi:MAG: carbohydrate-binding domain-containing protein [Bacilli bacterium]|nr:carbohydrate-binding domain-containing protein [Bacilli bacterium]
MKKVLFVLCLFAFGLFTIPKMVFAESYSYIKIRANNIAYEVLEGEIPEGVTYNESTNTLTLTNFTGSSLEANGDYTIILEGENVLDDFYDGIIIRKGNLTIEGTGSLNANCFVIEGNLEINSGTISIDSQHNGIDVEGDLTINDGIINVISQEAGIEIDGNIVINKGTLTIEGKHIGISINGNLTINGGAISINSALGIVVESERISESGMSSFIINNGKLEVKTASEGIKLDKSNLKINDGKITIQSKGETAFEGIAQVISDDYRPEMTMSGGSIVLDGFTYAICFGTKFKLAGSDILIKNSSKGITSYSGRSGGRQMLDYFFLDSGSVIMKDFAEENNNYAIKITASNDETKEMIKYNSENIYVEDPRYDFRGEPVSTDNEDIYLAEEDFISMYDTPEKIATNIKILSKYKIIEGDKQTITNTAEGMRIEADIDNFVALYINDELVGEDSYTLEEGSTIIRLNDDYVQNLEEGTYTIRAEFTTGYAEGTFEKTIAETTPEVEESETSTPATGDKILYSIILFALSSIAIIFRKKIFNRI